jgi:hypothetical protein
MTKPIRLSNSQISTFTDCNRKWHLDKVQKIRPTFLSSPLYFGTIVDETIEHILLKKEGSHLDTFYEKLNNFQVNGSDKKMPDDLLSVRFGAGDVDANLVDQKHVNDACDRLKIDQINKKDFLEYCKQKRKRKSALDSIEQYLFNHIAWVSLEQKGLMLVEKLSEWIEENVVEVHSAQKKIEISNENGDSFIGFLDFIATLKNGKKVLVDLKTSSNPNAYYPEDSASKSVQLGIYSQQEKLPNVAYLVADKKIRKREPRVRLKYVEGVITEEWLDEVFDMIEEATEAIKEKLPKGEEAFEKNLDSCMNFGGCQYRGLCEKGSMKGLEVVK